MKYFINSRYRNFILTICDMYNHGYQNNIEIMEVLVNNLKTLAYLAIMDEIEPNQKYVTHVYISCVTSIRIKTLQKLIPEAHIEPAYGSPQLYLDIVRGTGDWIDPEKARSPVQGTFHEWGVFPSRIDHKLTYANMRNQVLFGEPFDESLYQDGIRYFDDLPLDALDYLITYGFLNEDDSFSNSPSVAEFREFLVKYPSATLHGFADTYFEYCDIVITGCSCHGKLSKQFIIDFCNAFHDADAYFAVSDQRCSCTYD